MSNYEQVFEIIGPFGTYQKFCALLLFSVPLCLGFQSLAAIFLNYQPEFQCFGEERYLQWDSNSNSPSNASILFDSKCSDDCNKNVVYKFTFNTSSESSLILPNSVVAENNWICDKKIYSTLSISVQFLGYLIGSFLSGISCDSLGRKATIIYPAILNFLIFYSTSSVELYQLSFFSYLISRFLAGVTFKLFVIAFFVHLTENCGSRYASLLGIVGLGGVNSIGLAITAVAASYLVNWRDLSKFLGGSALIMSIIVSFVPKSARFLATTSNNREQAVKILVRTGVKNGKIQMNEVIEKTNEIRKILENEDDDDQNSNNSEKIYTTKDLFTNGSHLKKSICHQIIIWFAANLLYYGLSFNSVSLPYNVYLTNFIYAISELPAYIMAAIISCSKIGKKIGRAKFVGYSFYGAGISVLLGSLIKGLSHERLWLIILGTIGKCLASCVFMLCYSITNELFPTKIRGNAIGTCSAVSRVGAMLSPLLVSFNNSQFLMENNLQFVPGLRMVGF